MKKHETNILLDIKEDIGYIKGDMSGIKDELKQMNGSNIRRDQDINGLKRDRDIITGKITVFGIVCGFIGAVIIACIKFFQT